jgi:5-methyltetrahydrofolate--homocysteine methyltransferase
MIDAMAAAKVDVPLIVQVTVETTGTLLVGSEIAAVVATLARFPLAALGINCATGPARDDGPRPRPRESVRPSRFRCFRTRGFPNFVDGKTRYPLSPPNSRVGSHASPTTSASRSSAAAAERPRPTSREVARNPRRPPARAVPFGGNRPSRASTAPETLSQDTSLLLVGERTNSNGSRQFKRLLETGDVDGMVRMAREQVAEGSHVLDVCVAYVGRDDSRGHGEGSRALPRRTCASRS